MFRPLACRLLVVSAALAGGPATAQNVDGGYGAALAQATQRAREESVADAINILSALTRSHPDRPEAFNNLAVLYARQGDLSRARDLLARAINTHPSFATTYRNLNEVLGELAARAYDQALNARAGQRPQPRLALIEQALAPAPTVTHVALIEPSPQSSPPAPPAQPTRAAAQASRPTSPASSAAGTDRAPEQIQGKAPEPQAAAVLATVAAWARAWSEQDVSGYLNHYDRRFRPGRGLTRPQWENQRKKRLTRPKFIRVEIVKPSVRFTEADLAVVRFKQRYRSNSLRSDVIKELRLRRRGSRWRILEERV